MHEPRSRNVERAARGGNMAVWHPFIEASDNQTHVSAYEGRE